MKSTLFLSAALLFTGCMNHSNPDTTQPGPPTIPLGSMNSNTMSNGTPPAATDQRTNAPINPGH